MRPTVAVPLLAMLIAACGGDGSGPAFRAACRERRPHRSLGGHKRGGRVALVVAAALPERLFPGLYFSVSSALQRFYGISWWWAWHTIPGYLTRGPGACSCSRTMSGWLSVCSTWWMQRRKRDPARGVRVRAPEVAKQGGRSSSARERIGSGGLISLQNCLGLDRASVGSIPTRSRHSLPVDFRTASAPS